jgi:hypothetical protein
LTSSSGERTMRNTVSNIDLSNEVESSRVFRRRYFFAGRWHFAAIGAFRQCQRVSWPRHL